MKQLLTLTILAIFSTTVSRSQTFEKIIQGTYAQFGTSIQGTSDGGFIITGYTQDFGIVNGYNNVYLVRTDANGDTLWTRTFSGTGDDQGFAVQQTGDGGFLVAGTTNSFGSVGKDVYLIRTDASGDLLWSKTYGGIGEDIGYGLALTADGGAIIAGQSGLSGGPGGGLNTYVIRTNASGDTLWTRTYNSGSDNFAYSVSEVAGGDHILAGVGAFGIWYMELLRIHDDGTPVWNKAMTTGYAAAYSAVQTNDGGFIVAGILGSACLVKTDANGDTLWTKTYDGPSNDYGYCVRQTPDSGYVFSGENFSHTWLVRTDAQGDTLWQHTYSGGNAEVNQVVLNADGGYTVGANSSGVGVAYAVQLVRTDANGGIPCNVATPATVVSTAAPTVTIPALSISSYGTVSTPATVTGSGGIVNTSCTTVGIVPAVPAAAMHLYPDPASDELNLVLPSSGGFDRVSVLNAQGQSLIEQHVNTPMSTLRIATLASGLYFVALTNASGKRETLRFVKE